MGIKWNTKKLEAKIQKYKYPILILVIGLLLMAVPSFNTDEKAVIEEPSISKDLTLEDNLNYVLSKVDGAGSVEVLLTQSTGEEMIYQTDNSTSDGDAKTVTVTNAQRDETGLIRRVIAPVYKGAVIVCQGGDIPTVRYAIIDAVSKITGLGVNQISVLKMK